MDGASGRLSDPKVHLVGDDQVCCPPSCTRAKCTVLLGRDSPRMTRDVALATCAACIAGWSTELERRVAQELADRSTAGVARG